MFLGRPKPDGQPYTNTDDDWRWLQTKAAKGARRLAILEDVAAHPHSSTHEVRKRLGKPRATVDRQLQALDMLGVLDMDEVALGPSESRTRWHYTVADGIDPQAIDAVAVT